MHITQKINGSKRKKKQYNNDLLRLTFLGKRKENNCIALNANKKTERHKSLSFSCIYYYTCI